MVQEMIDMHRRIVIIPFEKAVIPRISSHRLPFPGSGTSGVNKKIKNPCKRSSLSIGLSQPSNFILPEAYRQATRLPICTPAYFTIQSTKIF